MDIQHRIDLINEDIALLRTKWKAASTPMKKLIEEEAKKKNMEIRVLQSVIRRREKRPPQPELQQKLI